MQMDLTPGGSVASTLDRLAMWDWWDKPMRAAAELAAAAVVLGTSPPALPARTKAEEAELWDTRARHMIGMWVGGGRSQAVRGGGLAQRWHASWHVGVGVRVQGVGM